MFEFVGALLMVCHENGSFNNIVKVRKETEKRVSLEVSTTGKSL
jgi:hypothetical protein